MRPFGVGALFLADDEDGSPAETAEPAHDGFVLGEIAVTRERREILNEGRHIIEAMRPLRMAGDLRLLPGRQLAVRVDGEPPGPSARAS